ncbi:uncharacterized protein [Argopecten irradians]|uniref:uncharacterized protein n=1 Tax=Argopecten irradians TaxID=31199 RepID=UPI0037220A4F
MISTHKSKKPLTFNVRYYLDAEHRMKVAMNVRLSVQIHHLGAPHIGEHPVLSIDGRMDNHQYRRLEECLPLMDNCPASFGRVSSPSSSIGRSPSSSNSSTGDNNNLLHEIKSYVKQCHTLLLRGYSQQNDPSEGVEDLGLPLNCLEDVERTENLLKDNAMKNTLIKHLCSLGGLNKDDIIKRMMAAAATLQNGLAIQYNWVGRGRKRPFSKLMIARVIIDSSKRQGLTSADAETEIKTWRKYSKDREGGRMRRQANTSRMEEPVADDRNIGVDSSE